MNKKYLSILVGGLMASSAAMAAVDYTLEISPNLSNTYSSDSGYYTSTWAENLGSSNWTNQTTQSILGTYQSAGQWYQTTQFTTVTSYDNLYRDRTDTSRYLSFEFSGAGDQWVDLSLNTSSPMNYYVSTYGTYGSKTSPRFGTTQSVSPTLGVAIDGGSLNTASSSYKWGSDWYDNASGSVTNSLRATVEATDGGAVSRLQVNLSSNPVFGTTRTEHVSYVSSQYSQDVLISAPVPEPESWAMLMAGLGLVGFIARRRQRAAN